MGGSTADTPTTPEFLRASDAERDHAVSELRNEFAEGRLSHETFMYRMQSALDARNRGQLAGLFTDLPPRRPGLLARIRAALRGEAPARAWRAAGRGPRHPAGPADHRRTVPAGVTGRGVGTGPGQRVAAGRRPRGPGPASSSRPAAGPGSPSAGPATATCA